MILRRLLPTDGLPIDTASIDTDAGDARGRLAELYAPESRRWLRINMIASVDGDAIGADGTSNSLSNPADRLILGVIRDAADVVLVGAASVRTEGYRLPKGADLAVVTTSGDLGGHRLEPRPDGGRLIVICPPDAEPAARASVGALPVEVLALAPHEGILAVADVIAALRERGYESIVCEGGPNLAGRLLDADLVDELCLSTSPQLAAARLPVFGSAARAPIRLALSQLLIDETSGLYARWRPEARSARS